MAYRNYAPQNGFIVAKDGTGDFTTITSAVAAAVTLAATSAPTIYVRPGTYTENFTVSIPLLIVAENTVCRYATAFTAITGTITITETTGNVGIKGFVLNTNSAVSISLTGNGASVIIQDCYFNASNANSISATGNNTTNLIMENCGGAFASTYTLFTTTNCVFRLVNCNMEDASGTLTASTSSAGSITLLNSSFGFPFATTSTGAILAESTKFGVIFTIANQTWITTAGTGTCFFYECAFNSGTSSAISVGAGTTLNLTNSTVISSNTNAITGAGTLNYGGVVFAGTSSLINTTTTNPIANPVLQGGTGLTATTINQILYSSAANTIAGLATANNGVLVTSASGVPSILANGTTGQVLTATTSNPATWSVFPAGATSGLINTTGLTWTNVALKAGTSLQLVAAQGSGILIVPVMAIFKMEYGGTNAFTNNITIQVNYGSVEATGTIMNFTAETNFWQSTSNQLAIGITSLITDITASNAENTAVYATLSGALTGNAAGNNTVKVQILWYSVTMG